VKNLIALVQHNPIGPMDVKDMTNAKDLYDPTIQEKLAKVRWDMLAERALRTLGEKE
jgi:hypothetical protein